MREAISDAQLHKLLDEVRLADADFQRAEEALVAAQKAKERATQVRSQAHNAARPHLQAANGPVIYDGYVWQFSQLHVAHERIGRDLTPRQDALPLQASAAA
jgi:hypothetical protein